MSGDKIIGFSSGEPLRIGGGSTSGTNAGGGDNGGVTPTGTINTYWGGVQDKPILHLEFMDADTNTATMNINLEDNVNLGQIVGKVDLSSLTIGGGGGGSGASFANLEGSDFVVVSGRGDDNTSATISLANDFVNNLTPQFVIFQGGNEITPALNDGTNTFSISGGDGSGGSYTPPSWVVAGVAPDSEKLNDKEPSFYATAESVTGLSNKYDALAGAEAQHLTDFQSYTTQINMHKTAINSFTTTIKDYTDTINTFTADINSHLEVFESFTNTIANDYYTKEQTYSRGEVNTLLADAQTGGSVNLSDYFTKTETNEAIDNALQTFTTTIGEHLTIDNVGSALRESEVFDITYDTATMQDTFDTSLLNQFGEPVRFVSSNNVNLLVSNNYTFDASINVRFVGGSIGFPPSYQYRITIGAYTRIGSMTDDGNIRFNISHNEINQAIENANVIIELFARRRGDENDVPNVITYNLLSVSLTTTGTLVDEVISILNNHSSLPHLVVFDNENQKAKVIDRVDRLSVAPIFTDNVIETHPTNTFDIASSVFYDARRRGNSILFRFTDDSDNKVIRPYNDYVVRTLPNGDFQFVVSNAKIDTPIDVIERESHDELALTIRDNDLQRQIDNLENYVPIIDGNKTLSMENADGLADLGSRYSNLANALNPIEVSVSEKTWTIDRPLEDIHDARITSASLSYNLPDRTETTSHDNTRYIWQENHATNDIEIELGQNNHVRNFSFDCTGNVPQEGVIIDVDFIETEAGNVVNDTTADDDTWNGSGTSNEFYLATSFGAVAITLQRIDRNRIRVHVENRGSDNFAEANTIVHMKLSYTETTETTRTIAGEVVSYSVPDANLVIPADWVSWSYRDLRIRLVSESGNVRNFIFETHNLPSEALNVVVDFGGLTYQYGVGIVGQKGDKGDDGFSPSFTISDISGGSRLVITSASGSQTINIMDGANGADGAKPNITGRRNSNDDGAEILADDVVIATINDGADGSTTTPEGTATAKPK